MSHVFRFHVTHLFFLGMLSTRVLPRAREHPTESHKYQANIVRARGMHIYAGDRDAGAQPPDSELNLRSARDDACRAEYENQTHPSLSSAMTPSPPDNAAPCMHPPSLAMPLRRPMRPMELPSLSMAQFTCLREDATSKVPVGYDAKAKDWKDGQSAACLFRVVFLAFTNGQISSIRFRMTPQCHSTERQPPWFRLARWLVKREKTSRSLAKLHHPRSWTITAPVPHPRPVLLRRSL